MCARKYMLVDKSTFGSQNMPKKCQQEKIFFCTFNIKKGQLPIF